MFLNMNMHVFFIQISLEPGSELQEELSVIERRHCTIAPKVCLV